MSNKDSNKDDSASLADNLNHRRRKTKKVRNSNELDFSIGTNRNKNAIPEINMTYFPSLKLSSVSTSLGNPQLLNTTKNSDGSFTGKGF